MVWIKPETDVAVLARSVQKPERAAMKQAQVVVVLDAGVKA